MVEKILLLICFMLSFGCSRPQKPIESPITKLEIPVSDIEYESEQDELTDSGFCK